MSLSPGARVGVYEVVELVGVGGMGEVYRARDTSLDRPVALKTLPDEFASDPERLARFAREARMLAQLNHPHIASIYGLETGTLPALAMEMVEGETLADRIAAGSLPMDEALAIARQIAEALQHAHDKGIVHRDLKPANVKLGPRDAPPKVKVLDFGLAKAMMADATSSSLGSVVSSPTITSPANMTRAGLILGTAAYMAPEQARGKQVDQRADIWAFGCVLYEMLTARRAFDGEEITDVLARVIQSEPEWSALPASTPRALTTLLQRCLRKDPARRLHSIADARIDLDEIAAGAPEQVQETTAPTRRSWWMPALTGAALGAALTAVASLTMMSPWSQPAAARVLRYTVPMPDGWEMLRAPGSGRLSFDVSPDGEKLLVVLVSKEGTRRVFVRRLDEVAFRELTGTDGAQAVYWAPDSQRFGFLTPSGMRRSDLSGASSQSMVTLPGFSGASWGSRDQIIAATGVGRPIFRWSAAGGSAEPIGVTSKDIVALAAPSWLPDDRGYLYVAAGGPGHGALMVQTPEREAQSIGEFEVPGTGQLSAHYRSGHLLVAASDPTARSVLTAQPFDLTTLRTMGEPAVLLTDLNSAFSASETGVLVYGEGQFAGERFVWLDHQGNALATVTERIRPFNFDLSPDERFMVIQQTSPGLLLHDLTRGVTTNIGQQGSDPIWSPDGKQIAFVVAGGEERGIHVMPAFGGPSKVLYAATETTYLDDWSRDGQWLAGHVGAGGPGILIPLSPGAKPIVFEDKSNSPGVDETRFSPDGRWLAYGLNSSGSGDVFVTAVPPTGERWKISVAGGAQPRWRVDGKALYFLSLSGTMMLVDIQATPGRPPEISAPRALFETGLQVQVGIDQFAVNKDGTRFLVRRPDEAADASLNQLHVIVNWPGLLKSETGRSR